jgi:predicted DNA-binding protein
MTTHQVTITLPDEIYQKVNKQSQLMERSVADEVTAVVISSVQEREEPPTDIEQILLDLELFTDKELWQAARAGASSDKEERMQELIDKQQSLGLTDSEKQELNLLSNFFSRIMLIRAKSAALLKMRGHDVHQLLALESLE